MTKLNAVTDTREHIVPYEPIAYNVYHRLISRYIFAGKFVQGKVVLDIGCGAGLGEEHWLGRGAKSVTGVDVNREAIKEAKQWNNGGTDFMVADAQTLPFADNSFDTIMALETIEHLRDANAFLAVCQRLLKTEGRLICCTSNREIVSPLRSKPRNPHHIREFNLQEFRTLIDSYFTNTTYYKQRISHSRAKFKLIATVDSIATTTNNGRLRQLLIKLSNPILAQPHYSCFSRDRDFRETLDKHYAITELHGRGVPETLIVVAQGSKC